MPELNTAKSLSSTRQKLLKAQQPYKIPLFVEKANFGLLNCLYKPELDKARLLIMISPGSAQAPKR